MAALSLESTALFHALILAAISPRLTGNNLSSFGRSALTVIKCTAALQPEGRHGDVVKHIPAK